jgi:subtilisin family serine protease
LSIIDSGLPLHKDIATDTFKAQNFTSSGSVYDVFGHSTAVAGIIAAKGSGGIKGLAPESDLYFAKALDDGEGNGDYESVIKAILWSIGREVDIILMSFGSPTEHGGLKDAIRKAGSLGIPMFAAGGNCTNRTRDVDFPARYDEVFSVGFSNNISRNEVIREGTRATGVILTVSDFETTFADNKFATMNGSSLCAAAVAGIGILAFQRLRREGFNVKNPQILYDEIGRLAVRE